MNAHSYAPVRAGDQVTQAQITRIVEGLKDCTLPKAEWTHQAHLISAVTLIESFGLNEAEARMPDFIRRYNESVGGKNTDSEGYHHTITLFYLRQISKFLNRLDDSALADKVNRLLASTLAEPSYPLSHYSREHLFSVEARRKWVAPDHMDSDRP